MIRLTNIVSPAPLEGQVALCQWLARLPGVEARTSNSRDAGHGDGGVIHALGLAAGERIRAEDRGRAIVTLETSLTEQEQASAVTLAQAGCRLVCPAEAQGKRLSALVGDRGHVRVIPPPVAPSTHDRDEVRRLLGLTDDRKMVFSPGVSDGGAEHFLALWGMGVVSYLDEKFCLVLRGEGSEVRGIRKLIESSQVPGGCVLARETTARDMADADLAAAADLVLLTASKPRDALPMVTGLRSGRRCMSVSVADWQESFAPSGTLELAWPTTAKGIATSIVEAFARAAMPAESAQSPVDPAEAYSQLIRDARGSGQAGK